jgi:hypothetical protein
LEFNSFEGAIIRYISEVITEKGGDQQELGKWRGWTVSWWGAYVVKWIRAHDGCER